MSEITKTRGLLSPTTNPLPNHTLKKRKISQPRDNLLLQYPAAPETRHVTRGPLQGTLITYATVATNDFVVVVVVVGFAPWKRGAVPCTGQQP